MRPNLKYLLLATCLGLAVVVPLLTPEPIDWSMSFSRKDRIPFGSLVVFETLPQMFAEQKITATHMPVYNILGEREFGRTNYIFLNNVFAPDELDTRELLDFVANGNSAFIAANIFSGKLADTLKLATDAHFVLQDSVCLNFVNPHLRAASDYEYQKQTVSHYFSRFDTTRATILGRDSRGQINYIRLHFGRGDFYLHSFPLAFTNYNMLARNNHEYVAKAFSYLSQQDTFWDEYYKLGRSQASTPLRYVLSQAPLRYAYYLGLAGVLLFILFQGKRRQRVIPVITPKVNTSLAFVATVGRLYYQAGDHKNLVRKKLAFFAEYLRTRFYLSSQTWDEEFVQRVIEKSGHAPAEVRALFMRLRTLQNSDHISADDLLQLNAALEKFYAHSG